MTGRWRIVETDLWDQADLDLVAPAFIEIKPDRTGRFGFIAVSGWMDWRNEPAEVSRVEFSWEGTDEGGRSAAEDGPASATTVACTGTSTSTSATTLV